VLRRRGRHCCGLSWGELEGRWSESSRMGVLLTRGLGTGHECTEQSPALNVHKAQHLEMKTLVHW
jgi:hypothetical protein